MASVTTTYDYEGLDGAAATAASAEVFQTPGSNTTHSQAMAVHGGTGIQFLVNTTQVSVLDHTSTQTPNPFAASPQQEIRAAITLPVGGVAVDNTTIGTIYGAVGSTVISRIMMDINGTIKVTDVGNSHIFTLPTNMSAYYGTKVAFHLLYDTGTTNINGSIKFRFHASPNDAFGTFVSEINSSGSVNLGSDTGTAYPIVRLRWGIATSQALTAPATKTMGVDYTQIKSESVAYSLGAPPAGTAPTANAGPDQYGQAGTFTYTDGGSVAGSGSITGYAWTVIEFPPGTANPSLSAPSGSTGTVTVQPGRTVLQLIVTNSSGIASPADTIFIWAYPASNVNVQVYKAPNGASNWTNEGGAASITAALNDTSVATNAKSPTSPVNEPLPAIMCPYGPGSITLNVEGVAIDAVVNRTITMYKEDGTTVIGTLGPFALPVITAANAANPALLAAAVAVATLTIGSTGLAAVAAISDRRALRWIASDNA